MIRPLSRSTRSKYRLWVVNYGLVLFISLPLVRIQASPDALFAGEEAKPYPDVVIPVQEDQQARKLEPGKPIERELAGGQSHSYQMTLAAGQYVRLVVDQRIIDVVVKLFGPDGKQITEFDSEIRTQGQETVSWVAKEAGSYRLDVLAKQRDAAAGRYQIQVVESRVATDNDRALHEAHKLFTEFLRLYGARKYDEARPLVEHVLEIRERVLGPEHFDVARPLNGLAALYYNKGDYANAESFYQRALAIREKVLGSEHPDIAQSLNNLAILYSDRGDYAKAEPLHQRALTIQEKVLGPEHRDVTPFLNTLANFYRKRGDYAKPEPLFQRALAIVEKVLGPEHTHFADTLTNLAIHYYERGDYAKAEPLLQRALAIREKALGSEHPDVAQSLNNLAILYSDRGDYAKAEPLLQRALTIREKVLGPEHRDVARVLKDFANLYSNKGDYAKAEPLFQRALANVEKVLGPEHTYVATTLTSLAAFHHKRGDYAKAEPLYKRALNIWEKSLGPEHPYIAEPLNGLAVLYAANGDIARAVTFLSRANAVDDRNLALNLAIGSERQKLAYLASFSKRTDFMLWLHSQVAPNDSQALDPAFTTLLRRKGRGLDAMTDTIATLRHHATPEDLKLFDKLADARSQLAALTLKEPDAAKPDTYRTRVNQLEDEVDTLEGEISSRSREFRKQVQPVTLAAVRAAIPAGSALVELAYFTPLDPKTERSKPPRYLAYLLPAQGQPKWVDLGDAALIDRAVETWREALRNPNRTDVKRLARAVDEKVMSPVRSLLGEMPGNTRRLLIAPDGSLNLIPFAALVDERNRYLVERYSINYLTSGRDLLRLQTSEPSKNAPLVVANPFFGSVETASTALDQNSGNSPAGNQAVNEGPAQSHQREVFFQTLPGTRREALAIKALLPEASVLLREEATEAALKQARAPRILHIATHGFFLGDQEAPPADTRSLSSDNSPAHLRPAANKVGSEDREPSTALRIGAGRSQPTSKRR